MELAHFLHVVGNSRKLRVIENFWSGHGRLYLKNELKNEQIE